MNRLAGRALALLCLILAAPAVATQSVSRSAAPPGATTTPVPGLVTGTWVGTLDLGGVGRQTVLVLRERARGDVYGYVLGGNGWWTIADGRRSGGQLSLTLVLAPEDGATTTFAISGAVGASTFSGTSDDGSGTSPLVMRRRAGVLHERRLAFADLVGGDPTDVITLSVVHDDAGQLVAGGFEALEGCGLFGCLGKVTAFSEVDGSVSASLESGAPCPSGGTLSGVFDPSSLFYTGTWTRDDCNGPDSGALLGARSTRTRSDHVQSILGRLDELADGFESGAAFGSAHPAISPSYRNFGWTAADVLARFDEEQASYSAIRAGYHRFYQLATIDDPTTLPDIARGPRIAFEQLRSGIPAGGGPREVYVDTFVRPIPPLLGAWADVGGWAAVGNQLPGFDLPFDYTVAGQALEIPTPGGTVHASFGSWGAHFGPMTGHLNGDAKTNGVGFLSKDDSDLTELVGNGNGVFETGETWGYWGGPGGDLVRDKTPVYTSPWDGTVVAVEYKFAPSGFYFDNPPQWEVYVEYPGGVEIRLGHVGGIAAPLRALVLAATGIDTSTYAGTPGDELLGGIEIPVAAGDPLCHPQMVAAPIPDFPGYYTGGGSFRDRPWAQLEWFLHGPAGQFTSDVCHFELIEPAQKAAIQAAIDAEADDPLSQRYRLYQEERWLWGAEGCACMTYAVDPKDFSSLFTQLGGWFEIDSPSTPTDELVAFAPIATNAASYDPGLYDPANVGWLLGRARSYPMFFTWLMPDGSSLSSYYPRAEVLDFQDDQLLVKWRELGYAPGGGPEVPVYQRAAYLLDGSGLKVKWGVMAESPAGAVLPILLPGDACNDVDVICYDHTYQPGY